MEFVALVMGLLILFQMELFVNVPMVTILILKIETVKNVIFSSLDA